MNRKFAAGILTALLAFSTVACDGGSTDNATDTTDNDSGIGMTYNGKLGYDHGGGFVQPFDGSSPSFGYGF